MAYNNNFQVAVTITPQWTEAQNTTNIVCAIRVPIVEHCYRGNVESETLKQDPSKECCKDLKTVSKTDVACLCYTHIANFSINSTIRTHYFEISLLCGVFAKFRCDGGKGANGGATNNIAASMSLFALVTNLLFLFH